MRSIKAIRKGNKHKICYNLLIAFSWLTALSNRFHIDLEGAVLSRFPLVCSYCGKNPCICKKEKIIKRVKIKRQMSQKPSSISQFQEMFNSIYPAGLRTLADSGIHLAEETGEVSETINVFLGEHKANQFGRISDELADWISCMFGVANSAKINVNQELVKMFSNNCHVCHKAPCICKFEFVYKFKS